MKDKARIEQTAQWYNPFQFGNNRRNKRLKENLHMLTPMQKIVTLHYKDIEKSVKRLMKVKGKLSKITNITSPNNMQKYEQITLKLDGAINSLNGVFSSIQQYANSKKNITTAQDFDLKQKQREYFQQIKETQNLANLERELASTILQIRSDLTKIAFIAVKSPELAEFIKAIQPALDFFQVKVKTNVAPTAPTAPTGTPAPAPAGGGTGTPTSPMPSTPLDETLESMAPLSKDLTSNLIREIANNHKMNPVNFYYILKNLQNKGLIKMASGNDKIKAFAQSSNPLNAYKQLSESLNNDVILEYASKYNEDPRKVYMALRNLLYRKMITVSTPTSAPAPAAAPSTPPPSTAPTPAPAAAPSTPATPPAEVDTNSKNAEIEQEMADYAKEYKLSPEAAQRLLLICQNYQLYPNELAGAFRMIKSDPALEQAIIAMDSPSQGAAQPTPLAQSASSKPNVFLKKAPKSWS